MSLAPHDSAVRAWAARTERPAMPPSVARRRRCTARGPACATVALVDDELVRLAQAGDEAAFAALVERHRRGVHALARRFLGSKEEAEDATQETFARAFAHLPRYAPDGRFGSWLLAICAHWCLDAIRARRRRVATVAFESYPDSGPFISAEAGPEERAVRRSQRDEVRGWLATLPRDYRTVLALRYERECSYTEIAATLDLPLSTVRMRLHRAHRAAYARAREGW